MTIDLQPRCPIHKPSELPPQIKIKSDLIDKLDDYSQYYFSGLATTLLDVFFLPLRALYNSGTLSQEITHLDPYMEDKTTHQYFRTFTKIFNGTLGGSVPTFSHFDELKMAFTIHDIPCHIQTESRELIYNLRFVQSKDFGQNQGGLRLILLSLNENSEIVDGKKVPLHPKSLQEMGTVPVEIMKKLKQDYHLDTLFCFSLGAITLDALKDIGEDVLPKNIILDRSLTSIRKVAPASVPLFPLYNILHWIAQSFHLDADPETHFLEYLEKNPDFAKEKTIINIRARLDHYFSDTGRRFTVGDYSPGYFERLKKVAGKVFSGSFVVPYTTPLAHHAARHDQLLCHPHTGSITHDFLPTNDHESLADVLARFMGNRQTDHTALMVGGTKDNLDAMLHLNTGILNSWIQIHQQEDAHLKNTA